MAAAPPALPTDSNGTAGQPIPPSSGSPQGQPSPSPFGGGPNAIMQALTQIEQGLQTLGQTLPSMASFAADTINNLRTALPQALAGNQAGGGQPSQPPSAPGMMPPPGAPPQGQ